MNIIILRKYQGNSTINAIYLKSDVNSKAINHEGTKKTKVNYSFCLDLLFVIMRIKRRTAYA